MSKQITAGDTIPAATLVTVGATGPTEIKADEFFAGRKVVVFAVPGAFTPTCSVKHLPGFMTHSAEFRAKGVDAIACLAVNDVFVMQAWAKANDVGDDISMLADGSGLFARALGLELDLTSRGMGVRAQRFALVATNGVVDYIAVEQPGEFDVSRAEAILEHV